MTQFHVYRNLRPSAAEVPYLLDVQTELLPLETRAVIPLVTFEHFRGQMPRLHPQCSIEGREVVMSTADLASVPRRDLHESVADLTAMRGEILAALNFLFTGY